MNATQAPRQDSIDPACPLCGSRERRTRLQQGVHRVVDCAVCGMCYVTPRRSPTALIDEVYAADYWRSDDASHRGYLDYRADEALYLRTFRRRLERHAKWLPRGGRALDVGCAAGFGMRALEAMGFEAHGIEPSEEIRASALAHFPAERLRAGRVEEVEFEPASFDLIAMWDVLEHTIDPLAVLRRVHGWLRTSGRLILETQDVESLAARAMGGRWTHYKHDEHLLHFSPRTLRRALDEAGFETLVLSKAAAGKYVSPAFIAERARRVVPWLAPALRPLARRRGAIYVNPGDEMIAIARARD